MNCRICNNDAELEFRHKVIGKYNVKYYYCTNCSFLFTEDPYWLDESYMSPINISDTGIIRRNLYFSKILSTLIFLLFDRNEKFLDYAGGYGILTRLMRDIGFDFYWYDKFTKNIFARGFEVNQDENKKFELLTTLEVFEHLVNPVEEIEKMLRFSSNILFSTELLPIPVPAPQNWWYYSFDHGQHISFYSRKTLNFIAKKFKLNFYSCGEIHLFTKNKFNPFIYYLLVKSGKYGLGAAISLFRNSKIWEDHLYLKSKSQNE